MCIRNLNPTWISSGIHSIQNNVYAVIDQSCYYQAGLLALSLLQSWNTVTLNIWPMLQDLISKHPAFEVKPWCFFLSSYYNQAATSFCWWDFFSMSFYSDVPLPVGGIFSKGVSKTGRSSSSRLIPLSFMAFCWQIQIYNFKNTSTFYCKNCKFSYEQKEVLHLSTNLSTLN